MEKELKELSEELKKLSQDLQVKNSNELKQKLIEVIEGLSAGTLELKVAAELNKSAGKIINVLKLQLEYFSLKKENPEIKFLEP